MALPIKTRRFIPVDTGAFADPPERRLIDFHSPPM
jgi:hypothetical protein